MRGKGISIGQPQPRTCSGGKTLKKCKNKGAADNVVIIDVDSDNYNNVTIIDVPEFLPKRFRGSSSNGLRKDEKYSFTTVICIDDDDINSENNNSDEGQFVQENNFPVKLSKCKRTYSGKASTSNCYGLNTDSESGSSDDDCPDFEFEGSSGKLKELWEKAFLKRQNDISSRDYQAGTSRFCTDDLQDNGKEKRSDRCNDDSDSPSLSGYEEVDRSPSIANDNGKSGSTLKMKNDICNGHQSGMRDCASASRSCIDSNQDVGIGNKTNENGSIEKKNDVFNSQSCLEDTGNDSLFFNREMHKETDEYKRSIEEELASRQRELQIQAEEAKQLKRLQKRKRAESMRLLDMERRQKQRLEEMRETQKKDEENLNLKEQLRAEVRKDLNRLETSCHDMASILHGLGIHVSGDSGADEVRVAFKRALLRFHPDRASQSDIRQQVEAEEKFKLISRMKDKFLSTS